MRPLLPPRPPRGRDGDPERLASTAWDLLVIGGGSSGVAVAHEAAQRGLSVALVEQDDIASGTSSRSSRLIHGGLRYLAQGELGLVREGLRERRRLLRTAPGLVRPVPFLYPIYRGDPDGRWKVGLGLWLYDFMSLGDGLGWHRRWSARRIERQIPSLGAQGLRGGFLYRDAATHDARLTLAVALAARRAGAHLVSRCRVLGWRRGEPGVELEIEDRLGARTVTAAAAAIVLACGPFSDLLRPRAAIRTARGAHLSFPAGRLPVKVHLALRSPDDDRLAFAMPAGAYTVVGTTDIDDPTPPAEVRATPDDVAYLLRLTRHAFPLARIESADVVGLWAGQRPLLTEEGTVDPDELSRRHRVLEIEPAIFALQGGKLTTHRLMAVDTLDRVRGGREARAARRSGDALLTGSLAEGAAALRRAGVGEGDVAELAGLYGARLDALAARVVAAPGSATPLEERVLRAQIELAVDEEWALTLDDVLLRRLLPGPLNLRLSASLAPWAAGVLASRLAWSAAETRLHLREFSVGIAEEFRVAGLGEAAGQLD
jgi:glycerol-3-phosphate dehydrogenase